MEPVAPMVAVVVVVAVVAVCRCCCAACKYQFVGEPAVQTLRHVWHCPLLALCYCLPLEARVGAQSKVRQTKQDVAWLCVCVGGFCVVQTAREARGKRGKSPARDNFG